MGKYYYEVSGEYDLDLLMKKDDKIVHNGSALGIVSYWNNRVETNLNYGKKYRFLSEFKVMDDLIILVPMKDYLYSSDYQYMPLVFEPEEFQQLIQNSYIDDDIVHYIPQINKEDIFNLFLVRFRLECDMMEMLSFKNIIDSIVASSEGTDKVITLLQSFLYSKKLHLRKLDHNITTIALYIDISDKIYEWNTVYKVDETYYLEIADKYAIEIC